MTTSTGPGAAIPGRRVGRAEALHITSLVFRGDKDGGTAGARDERSGGRRAIVAVTSRASHPNALICR